MCHSTSPLGVVCLGTSDAPASSVRETNADAFQQPTTQPTQPSQHHRSRFANPALACQEPVRCSTARAGASFRFSAAQHPHGPSILLALAGKDIDSAFPDGPWQFYTQFGLREDAARHCVETTGFGLAAATVASELDAATCWVYAAMRTLFGYDALLANEWEERALPRALEALLAERAATLPGKLPHKSAERQQVIAERAAELGRQYRLDALVAGWAKQRPYGSPAPDQGDAPLDDYPAYRRACFREYWAAATQHLPPDLHVELERRVAARRAQVGCAKGRCSITIRAPCT